MPQRSRNAASIVLASWVWYCMSAVSNVCSKSVVPMRDASSSLFFSAGIFRIVSSRKCSDFASSAVATAFVGASA